jgi:hypothetical protein
MRDVTEIKWKNVHAGGERNTPEEWDRTFDESSFISLITGLFYRKTEGEYRARDRPSRYDNRHLKSETLLTGSMDGELSRSYTVKGSLADAMEIMRVNSCPSQDKTLQLNSGAESMGKESREPSTILGLALREG